MKIRNLIITIIILLTGCATTEQGFSFIPIGLSLFRSPATIKTHLGKNGPLTDAEKCTIEAMLDDLKPGGQNLETRHKLKAMSNQPWVSNKECIGQARPYDLSDLNNLSPYDSLDDLYDNDTLVFVAISGGGARAAALAEAVFAHLERKYNALRNTSKSSDFYFPSLLNSIHAISTVSGGSLYAYRVARYKTQLDNEKNIINKLIGNLNDSTKAPEAFRSIQNSDIIHGIRSCSDTQETIVKLRELEKRYVNFSNAAANEYIHTLNEYLKNEEDHLLECIGGAYLGLSKQGLYSSWFYMSPFNLFAGPLITLLTDESYLSILAGTLHGSTSLMMGIDSSKDRIEKVRQIYDPSLLKLSSLTEKPRFFFNATALETGLPFVFTQRLLQLPLKSPLLSKTARLDVNLQQSAEKKPDILRLTRPLGALTTLEDLNSSPADTPLAFAAIASAAFPLGFEPLALSKYGYDPTEQRVYESAETLHVADGGLYDNAGLSTLAELFESISTIRRVQVHKPRHRPTLILLSINADADEYDSFFANKIPEEAGFLDKIPLEFNAPIRYGSLGVDSLSLIHYVNKRRAEQIAVGNIQKIKNIVCGEMPNSGVSSSLTETTNNLSDNNFCENEQVNFLYFPVSLAQLSHLDHYRISDPSDLFSRLKKIPTNYTISDQDKLTLRQAADLILSSKQEENSDWAKGVEKLGQCDGLKKPDFTRLDEAFAFSVLCANKRAVTPN